MFSQNIEEMSMEKLVEYITKTFHEPLRKDLKKLEEPVSIIINEYTSNFPDLVYLKELYTQFKSEILKHITREDFITFPSIIKYEKILSDKYIDLSDNLEIMDKLIYDVRMQNEHSDFEFYLNSIIGLFKWSKINNTWVKVFENLKLLFIKIHDDLIIHSNLENKDLYSKWLKLQEELKSRLENLKKI